MNHCVPEWNFEGDVHVTNQKKSIGPDHELVELQWQNGQVVLNSQTYRKQDQPRRVVRHDQADPMGIGSYGNSSHLIQDDEPVSWIHNPFDDSFEKEFCSSLFNDLPSSDPARDVPFTTFQQKNKNPMPPPRSHLPGLAKRSDNLEGLGSAVLPGKAVEGSSHCGSNQVQNDDLCQAFTQSERGQTETFEPTLASSSGGSDSSFEKTCRRKRKATYEESESPTEATELESAGGNKSSRRSGSAKRSRAAEVHNLSERRRRDKINEKMKALQELIPHCNKSDKASMLDEAIEYLKSLQLQLQVMWMGGGIGPMMFPGVHPYLSRMSMGMAPVMNLVNCPNQMQNHALTEQYARYLAFHQMQTNPQTMNMNMNMNMFRFNPQVMQQIHPTGLSGGSVGPFSHGATKTDTLT